MGAKYDPLIPSLRIGDNEGLPTATLPASPVTGIIYRLTAEDATTKAGPGLYVSDGTGWFCLQCFVAGVLGNLGAAPALTLIAGGEYLAVQDQNITTAPAITMARSGRVKIYKTGAFTVVGKPTMTGRTAMELYTDAWTPAGGAKAVWIIENDGVNIVSAATTMV